MLPVFSDVAMADHDPGGPDHPSRLGAALEVLERVPEVALQPVTPATMEELVRVHDPAYVADQLAFAGQPRELDVDTRTSAGSISAARLAAGAARDAVLAAIDGPTHRAMALVRPPGHHALRDAAMGFCLFNNVVVAAEAARVDRGIERVLIVDWDVHHGNGTEALVAGRADTLYFSTHQGFGFYPGTGQQSQGNAVNVPLHPGAGDAELLAAFRDVLRPAAAAFAPELVLVSAGFDAHVSDPLAELVATTSGYAALCREVVAIADTHAGGRIALILEGGYHLGALSDCVVTCARVLLE